MVLKMPGSILVAAAEMPPLRPNPTAFGFQIHKVINAGELWAAGLRLQEHLSAEMRTTDDTSGIVPEIALAWYPLAEGDFFLSPVSFNHGVRVAADLQKGVLKQWSSGWQNGPVLTTPPDITDHLYPEIYLYGCTVNFRRFSAMHRWVAGTVGPTGDFEQSPSYPALSANQVMQWNVADDITVADGAGVADWPDYSGRGRNLVQPTAAKRPIKMVDQLNGHSIVRFDGVNDFLRVISTPMDSLSETIFQPLCLFAVMAQRAEGAATQVWFGNPGAPPLIFRDNAAGKINVWASGSDITYDHGDWPMPFTIMSFALDGANSNVWENKVSKVSGDPGGSGFGRLMVGNNLAESLVAAIDVAEIIVTSGVPNTTDRNALIDSLAAKYGISV